MPWRSQQARSRSAESGFTLIEVLVVTVILGILVAIVIVSVLNAFERAKQRATMADMRTISKALEAYSTDTGRYPVSGSTMAQLSSMLIPYQTSVMPVEDHWRHLYVYTTDNVNNYSIESFGKDGVDGADISYANRFSFDLDLVLSNGTFTASPEL